MKTLKWLAVGLLTVAGAFIANAATTQHVTAPMVWIGQTTGTDNNGTYLSPTDVYLTNNQHQVFTAYPPNGYRVTWWAWGATYKPDWGIFEGGKVVTNLISNATTYEWTGSTSVGAKVIGVRFDYFPYTVELYKNDGKGSDHLTMSGPYYYPNSFKLVANSYTREGYTFGGWTNSVGTVFQNQASVSGASLGVTHDSVVKLYAKWNPIHYKVAFDGNESTGGSMSAQDFAYGVSQPLTANTYVRKYTVTFNPGGGTVSPASDVASATFGGWAQTASGNKRFDDQQSVQNLTNAANETVTLYAKWTLGSVTLPTPTKANNTFKGWYDAAEGGNLIGAAGANYTPTANRTIYAQWTKKYSARFRYRNANGMWTYSDWQYVLPGSYATAPDPSVYDSVTGYRFTGWSPSSLQVNQDNLTFQAQYQANVYYIVLEANDNSSRERTIECTYDVTYTLDNTFARDGYTFKEWNTAANGSGNALPLNAQVKNVLTEDTASTNLYAQWTAIQYGITFDANGGAGEMTPMSLRYDEAATLTKNAFVNSGRPFLGWRFDGRTYADEAVVSNLTTVAGTNLMFQAIWKDMYWIRFLPNGGTGEMPVQAIDTGATVALTDNAFENLGYTFAGWATNATSSVKYADGEQIRDLAAPGETNDLYAVWATNVYAVAFVCNGGEGKMTNVTFRCHEPALLPSNAFVRTSAAGSWMFRGWSLDPTASAPDFTDEQEVTNLTYEANAEVTLYALWQAPGAGEQTALAVAVDCANLTFTTNSVSRWSIISNAADAVPGVSGAGASQYIRANPPASGSSNSSDLYVTLPTGAGVLRFHYRTTIDGTKYRPSRFAVMSDAATSQTDYIVDTAQTVSTWTEAVYEKAANGKPEKITWQFQKNMGAATDTVDIDCVTWTPDDVHTVAVTFRLNDGTAAPDDIWANYTVTSGQAIAQWPADPTGVDFAGWYTAAQGGTKVVASDPAPAADAVFYAHWGASFPVPTEKDRVEASRVVAEGGVLAVEFAADENFAYNLLATDSLAPTNWYKYYGPTNGTGTLRFVPAMDAPQRFFKIETIQRTE